MSHETVRRYGWDRYGTKLVETQNGPWMKAAHYDGLRTQARELAEAARRFVESWEYAGRQARDAWDLIQQAQAVLDATKEGG